MSSSPRVEIIRESPSDEEIARREAEGFEMTPISTGELVWVHSSDREEPTDKQLGHMLCNWREGSE